MAVSAASRPSWWRRSLAVLGALLGFAVVLALVARPGERLVHDIVSTTASPFLVPPDAVAIVAIGEATLSAFPYRAPIDRGFLAELVEKLTAARPRAIGIDLLFDQPTEPAKDRALAEAIGRAVAGGVPVVIASGDARDGLTPAQADWLSAFQPAAARGLARLNRDPFDGVVRRTLGDAGPDSAAGFAEAVAGAAGIPTTDRPAEERVWFRTADGAPFPFRAFPAERLRLIPPAWLAGRVVLIGVDLALEDRHATPFVALRGVRGGTLSGVAIHAHEVARRLAGLEVRTLPFPLLAAMTAVLAAGAAWLAWRPSSLLLKPMLPAGLIAFFWAAAILLFRQAAILVPLVVPSAVAAAAAAMAGFLAWKRDHDERAFIRRAFAQYLSPAVVDALVRDPARLRLGGEARPIVSIFTDLEGFTSWSERLPPERVASVLNRYLDGMCDLFVAHGATIDKVIGDAVVGFFGAPTPAKDAASRAVALALAVQHFAEAFRRDNRDGATMLGATRVGIHAGTAIVGNFGGERFFDYTAIGDTVNTAARLEGANKQFGTRICVSGAVAAAATGHLFRPIGTIVLKGKTEGVEVFEPLGLAEPSLAEQSAYLNAYTDLAAGDGVAAFEALSRRYPDDSLVRFHAGRLAKGETGVTIRLSEK